MSSKRPPPPPRRPPSGEHPAVKRFEETIERVMREHPSEPPPSDPREEAAMRRLHKLGDTFKALAEGRYVDPKEARNTAERSLLDLTELLEQLELAGTVDALVLAAEGERLRDALERTHEPGRERDTVVRQIVGYHRRALSCLGKWFDEQQKAKKGDRR